MSLHHWKYALATGCICLAGYALFAFRQRTRLGSQGRTAAAAYAAKAKSTDVDAGV